ncbi:MAG: hypothetical protein FGM39_04080 [Phycisphaerales bacterium]|nr:hypothetical protein [Phycisphaerales bacterium]
MMDDDLRSAVKARRMQVLEAAGRALDRSVRRRRAQRRFAAAGAVASMAVAVLVAAWPRPAPVADSDHGRVDVVILRGGESRIDVTVVRGGHAHTISPRRIGDDELDAELLSALGDRFGSVGMIRRGREVAVIDIATGRSIALGPRSADE